MSLSLLSWCLAWCLHPAPSPEVTAADILSDWDGRRAAAWATGDAGALRALYTPGSRAARRDLTMLREWQDRGLRVEGLQMQLLAVRVVSACDDRLSLDVVDRVAGGVVVPGGRPLPRDSATAHRVVLRQTAGAWLVAAVRD